MMKKLLGAILILLPIIGILSIQVWSSGWLVTAISWVFALVMSTMIIIGIRLSAGD